MCECELIFIMTVKSFEGLVGLYQCTRCKTIVLGEARDCEGKIIRTGDR